jgi:hypothetical protein
VNHCFHTSIYCKPHAILSLLIFLMFLIVFQMGRDMDDNLSCHLPPETDETTRAELPIMNDAVAHRKAVVPSVDNEMSLLVTRYKLSKGDVPQHIVDACLWEHLSYGFDASV